MREKPTDTVVLVRIENTQGAMAYCAEEDAEDFLSQAEGFRIVARGTAVFEPFAEAPKMPSRFSPFAD